MIQDGGPAWQSCINSLLTPAPNSLYFCFMSHLHGGGLGEYKPCKLYGELHKVMYPLPSSSSPSRFHSPPLASGEMFSALLPPLSRKSFISLVVCSPCYFTACCIGWGEGVGCRPVRLNDCHLPFVAPCNTWKLFPHLLEENRQIDTHKRKCGVYLAMVNTNEYPCTLVQQ